MEIQSNALNATRIRRWPYYRTQHAPSVFKKTEGLEKHRALTGAWEEIRTPDLRITNALLYRLSYPGAERNISTSGNDLFVRALELHQGKHEVVEQ